MNIKINKNVFNAFVKKLKESSRGDTIFNNTTGFYGNHGSVKSFNATDQNNEELPLQPSPQMAVQLSVAEPPVDDPDFIPATREELGLAAKRISKEVPHEKIEYFYRKLHKLLDDALDEKDIELFELNESIDYHNNENIPPQGLRYLDRAFAAAGNNVKTGTAPEKAAQIIMQKINNYPILNIETVGFTEQDIIKHLKDIAGIIDTEPDTVVGAQEEPYKIKDPVSGIKYDPLQSLDQLEGPTKDEIKLLDKDLTVILHDIDNEKTEFKQWIEGWDFGPSVPLNRIIYAITLQLHEVSFELVRNNAILKHGGQYVGPTTKDAPMGIHQYKDSSPLSKSYAQREMNNIEGRYGLNYKNCMHQDNILKMTDEQLEGTLYKAISGLYKRMPDMGVKTMKIINEHYPEENLESAINFIAELLSHKYRGESLILDDDIVLYAIRGMFSRALIDLPDPIKIPKAPIGYGGNKPAFLKRAKIYPELFKKELPPLILGMIEKFRKGSGIGIKIEGDKYIFTHLKKGLSIKVNKADLLNNIKEYVNQQIDIAITPKDNSKTLEKDTDPKKETMAAMQKMDTEEEEGKEKLNIEGLTSEEADLKKGLIDVKKMIMSNKWMHIAPLFNFSGPSGVRQWFLIKPDAKVKISVAARKGLPAAVKAMEQVNFLYDTIIRYFIDDPENSKEPGILTMMLNTARNNPNLSDDDKKEIKLLSQIHVDLHLLAPLIAGEDIPILQMQEKYQELSKSRGGKVIRFLVGGLFDKILIRNYKEWEREATKMLTSEGLNEKDAKRFSQYLTGLKKIPKFSDTNPGKTARQFVQLGIEKNKFYSLYEKSYAWFFNNLEESLSPKSNSALKKEINYFDNIKNTLYNSKGKLNKSVFKKVSGMITDAIKEYQEDLGVEIATSRIQDFLKKANEENPKLNIFTDEEEERLDLLAKKELTESLARIIERYL